MNQLEKLKETLIHLTTAKGYPAELGMLMAANLGTEKSLQRMISYLSHTTPGSAEEMVDEMLAICDDRDFWMEKKKAEYSQQKYNQYLWEQKERD